MAGSDTDTALQSIVTARTLVAAVAAFRAGLCPFGIDTFSAGEVDLSHRNRTVFMVIDWPAAWRDFYFGSDLLQRDPLVENLGLYGGPFTWTQLRQDRRLATVGTEGLDRAAAAGWRDGLVVPIPRGGTRFGIVSIVARDRITLAARADMLPLCYGFHAAIGHLARSDGFAMPPAGMTPREIECLKLLVIGQSDRAIAATLGISPSTVHDHVERLKQRVGTRTRAELAAVAISLGIVSV